MANQYNAVLYIGVTNNLERRVAKHKAGTHDGFTRKYSINKLLYFETSPSITSAIEREKQLKGGSRAKKLALIQELNPKWCDLMAE
jgi:putative endonuclease